MLSYLKKYIGSIICPPNEYHKPDSLILNRDSNSAGGLMIYFPGNVQPVRSIANQKYTHAVNWPNQKCSSTKMLMRHVQQAVESIIKPEHKKVTLVGFSLGGHAALTMAKAIKEKNEGINVDIVAINTFSSLSQLLRKGSCYSLSFLFTTLLTVIISACIFPIYSALVITMTLIAVSFFAPRIITEPVAQVIKLLGWEMDNVKAFEDLKQYKNIKLEIHQDLHDGVMIDGARLYDKVFTQNATKSPSYKGDHESIPDKYNVMSYLND